MEQKDYKLEIVGLLLQDRNHIRGLAKVLATNQMMVSRRMKELSKGNAVDFKQEGKNKSYFLKKTTETRAYIFMFENYRLLQAVNAYPSLRRAIEKIQQDGRIRLAILFGSYAKGTANKESDIDIYLDIQDRELKREIALIDSRLSIKIGMYNQESPLIRELEKNHVIIKGVEEFYEKSKFFGQSF